MASTRAKPRQDPVSCHFCRSKKLKCNREFPCTNCKARGVTCKFQHAPPPAAAVSAEPLGHGQPATGSAEILDRLRRLENIILLGHNAHVQGGDDDELRYRRRIQVPTPESAVTNVRDIDVNRDVETQLLDYAGTTDDSLLTCLSYNWKFAIRQPAEIVEAANELSLQQGSPPTQAPRPNIILFPPHDAAIEILENFKKNVDHSCKILHIPTLMSTAKSIYLRLELDQPIPPGQTALLLATFAITYHFHHPISMFGPATPTADEMRLSMLYARSALDMLEHSRRSTSGSIEDAQASVIMCFVLCRSDGFSARSRAMLSNATQIARDLRLHRLDELSDSEQSGVDLADRIDHEVKRRVMWQIAATDWMLAAMSGPQEGMYFVQPAHLRLRRPQDCEDIDIGLASKNTSVAKDRPTVMSYFVQRLKFGELCLEMVDAIPNRDPNVQFTPYEQILAFDGQLLSYIADMPFYYRIDPPSRERAKDIESEYPFVPMQRYGLLSNALARRCKLHQPYMIRQSRDPRFAASRQACLESARDILRLQQELALDHAKSTGSTHISSKIGLAIHITHIAVAVLVMDLCFNPDETNGAERKAEVRDAFGMFEDASTTTPLAQHFLKYLTRTLQKYKVQLGDGAVLGRTAEPDYMAEGETAPVAAPNDVDDLDPSTDMQASDPFFAQTASFDDYWSMFTNTGESSVEWNSWDNLFSDLGTTHTL